MVGDTASLVAEIIEEVRVRGDAALVELMRKFADPDFEFSSIRVEEADFDRVDAGVKEWGLELKDLQELENLAYAWVHGLAESLSS